MASILGASAAVGGLCHAAERPVRWAAFKLDVSKHLFRTSLMILILLPLAASIGAVNPQTLDAINKTCVPLRDMALAGVRLGDSMALVESRLGAPVSRTGADQLAVFEFPGLMIRFHASRVQNVLATSPKWSTPAGIRPGLFEVDVNTILGFDLDSIEAPHSKSPTGYQIHRCIEPGEEIDVEQYIRLELSTERRITAVKIFWVAP